MLTPKNANGDYFTVGPTARSRSSTRTVHRSPSSSSTTRQTAGPGTPAPPDGGLATDEQQSGEAADAVRNCRTSSSAVHHDQHAEEKLSEVLLNAHATTTAGQQKLNDIQKKIVEAVNNPAMETKTAAGEKSYLTFLRSQVSAIKDLLASGSLSAADQSKAAQALAALYAADNSGGNERPGRRRTGHARPPATPRPGPGMPAWTRA